MTLLVSGLVYAGLASTLPEKENNGTPVGIGVTRQVARVMPSESAADLTVMSTTGAGIEIDATGRPMEQIRRVVVIPSPKARTRAS
jgi:hypothetical protein